DSALRSNPQRNPVNIAMVARFQHPKDQELAIRAFKRLKHTDARLLFAGDGPERVRLERAVRRDPLLRDKVSFVGMVKDVASLLADCQVFLLLSRHEGLPISVIEAMRAGLPVVASKVGGIPELIQDNVSGVLIDRRDPDLVAAVLARL